MCGGLIKVSLCTMIPNSFKHFISMRLATPCLFLALLGVSLVTGVELDRPGNLRRGLVSTHTFKG